MRMRASTVVGICTEAIELSWRLVCYDRGWSFGTDIGLCMKDSD